MSNAAAAKPAVLHHLQLGRGEAVALVHGVGGSIATSWGGLLDHVAQDHRVLAVDNPGSGLSPAPDGPLDLDFLADSIAVTAEAAGLQRYTVVGYSMGSAVAIRHAIRHPDRTAALALVAGFARADGRLRLALRNWRQLLDMDRGLLGRYLMQLSCGPAAMAKLGTADMDRIAQETATGLPPGTRQHIDLAMDLDVRADLPRVGVPSIVIAASDDVLVAPSHSDELAQGIHGSRLVHVRAGHDAPAEQPAVIAAHIRALTHR